MQLIQDLYTPQRVGCHSVCKQNVLKDRLKVKIIRIVMEIIAGLSVAHFFFSSLIFSVKVAGGVCCSVALIHLFITTLLHYSQKRGVQLSEIQLIEENKKVPLRIQSDFVENFQKANSGSLAVSPFVLNKENPIEIEEQKSSREDLDLLRRNLLSNFDAVA